MQIATDLVPVVQLTPQHGAQLRSVRHALPHQTSGLFGHAQNNGAALGAGSTTARRFEFGVDALGAGLQGGEKGKLANGASTQTLLQIHLPIG